MTLKRAVTTTGSDVNAVLVFLRTRARLLRTSLSDPSHISRKAAPDGLSRALVNPGSMYRVISLHLDMETYKRLLKDGSIKTAPNGFEVANLDLKDDIWSMATMKKIKLKTSERGEVEMCSKSVGDVVHQDTWMLHLPLMENLPASSPQEMLRPDHHWQLWSLVKTQCGSKVAEKFPAHGTPLFEGLHEATLFGVILAGMSPSVRILHLVMPCVSAAQMRHMASLSSVWCLTSSQDDMCQLIQEASVVSYSFRAVNMDNADHLSLQDVWMRKRKAEKGMDKYRRASQQCGIPPASTWISFLLGAS